MIKIKTKKEMNLIELIKWAWENDVISKKFDGSQNNTVYFDRVGRVSADEFIPTDETFTVEVEEEITEETKIPVLVGMYKRNKNTYYSIIKHNTSIISEKDKTPVAFYMLNEDYTMTLIWRNGGMVE